MNTDAPSDAGEWRVELIVSLDTDGPADPMAFAHLLEQETSRTYARCYAAHAHTPPRMFLDWRARDAADAASLVLQLGLIARAAGYTWGSTPRGERIGIRIVRASGEDWPLPVPVRPRGSVRAQLFGHH